jgi:hypothetical protein
VADLDVEGTITATAFESDAADGERYTVFGNNTAGKQPDTATVATGAYGYETDMYFVVGSSIHTQLVSGGDIILYGATDDNGFEYLVDITDPTADRTITIDDDNINFTAGAGEDNYVLKYDNSTNTWSAEADSTGSALGSNLASATNNITSDNDQISLEGSSEDIDLDFTSNTVTMTTDSGVTLFDFGTINIGTDSLDLSEGNITNVGSIALDAITADGTNVLFGGAAATQLQFRDTDLYIASLDDGHLDLEADTSIDLNAPVSGNGNWTTTGNVTAANLLVADTGTIGSASDTDAMSIAADGDVDVVNDFTAGTITSDAALTATTNVVIGDAGNIGSASDTDAIAVAANGEVTFSQEVQAGAGIDVSGGTLVVGTISGTMTDGTASWNASTQALTGFATFETDAAEVNGTITLANDASIANSTDTQILFADDGGENLAIDLDTATDNEIAISSPGGATDINFGSLNMATTGSILGATNIVTTTDGTESPSAAQMYGTFFVADHATATSDTDYTLPSAAAGMCACFYDNGDGAGGIIIDAAAGDIIHLDGTALDAADAIDSPGVAGDGANGDFICLMAIDDTTWLTLGRSGTWVDGGED